MTAENLEKIKKLFETVYLLKQEKVDALIAKFLDLPDEACDEILAVLAQAKDHQGEVVKKLISDDPSFVANLQTLLANNYKDIAGKVTTDEQNSAEHVLDNLENV
jgi:hypothetical protein